MARNTLIRHAYGITEIDFTDLLRGECKESDNARFVSIPFHVFR